MVVEDFQAAPAGDLADRGGVEAMVVVAVPTLHEDAAVTEALCIHLSSDVIKVDSFPDVSPGVFNSGVPVNIGEQPKAESVLIVGRIGETIHQHAGGGGVERFAHTVVELIVHNRAPVFWFLVSNCLNISSVDLRGQWRCRHVRHVRVHRLRAILGHGVFRRQVSRRGCVGWHLKRAAWV